MGKTNGTIALDKFQDNADPAVEVRDRGNHDMTAPIRGRQAVSKRVVREMFVKFMQSSPELRTLPREQQIAEFNRCRREAHVSGVDPDILEDLLVPEP